MLLKLDILKFLAKEDYLINQLLLKQNFLVKLLKEELKLLVQLFNLFYENVFRRGLHFNSLRKSFKNLKKLKKLKLFKFNF